MAETIKILQDAGLLWIFALVLLLPVGFITTAYLMKRFLFAGFGNFMKAAISEFLKDQKDRIAVDVKLEERLSDLVKQFESIGHNLGDHENSIGTKLNELDAKVDTLCLNCQKILYFAKKRQSDWIRPEAYQADTQQFLKERNA